MEQQAPPPSSNRDEVFDLAKGVGIIAVVVLHVSSRSAGLFHEPYSDGWWILKWINLFVNFCVPLFLLVSAILLARSVSKQERPDWMLFARKRLRSVLLPLAVWSIVYWLLRRFVQHDPRIMAPGYWFDLKARFYELIFGKAEFHLYFLSVLAQLCLVLPFAFLLYRRVRMNVTAMLLYAITMQIAAYLLHRAWPYDNPGSVVLWYLSPILPGIWIGMNWKDWPEIRSKTWASWITISVVGFVALGYETWRTLVHLHYFASIAAFHDVAYNLAPFYGLGAPVLILGLLGLWNQDNSRLKTLIRRLGEMSLQIYLIHPILLQWLTHADSWRETALKVLPLPSLWLCLLTLFGTYGISLVLERVGFLNPVLFGRDVPVMQERVNG